MESLTFMDLHLIKSKTDQKLHKNHSEKKFPILCVCRQTASPVCQKYANDVLISPQGLIIHWLRTKLNKTRNGMFDFSFRGWHHDPFSCARVCVSQRVISVSLPSREASLLSCLCVSLPKADINQTAPVSERHASTQPPSHLSG